MSERKLILLMLLVLALILAETAYFGWHWAPASRAELTWDVALAVVLGVLVLVPVVKS